MKPYTIALFGEAEKGEFHVPYFCQSLAQLLDFLGHPPVESRGLYYAVQALLYHRSLLFLRVQHEGFSESDYLTGIQQLKNQGILSLVAAYCMPGVGNSHILGAIQPLCEMHHSILITNEADLYDYLTENV
jgi:hypothetical protein